MDPSTLSQIIPRHSTNLKKTISNASGTIQPDPAQQISDTFTKLHQTIEQLDSKVQALMDKHEIEFLFAWQNHIKKIKNELKDIKERSEEKEKLMNSNERMVAMEKQMALFRDESLKLYEEVEDKKNEIEVLRRRLREQELELEILREENKELVKKVKMAEARLVLEEERRGEVEREVEKLKQLAGDEQKMMRMVTVDQRNLKTTNNLSINQIKTLGFESFNLNGIRSTQHTGVNFEKKVAATVKQSLGHESHPISKLKQHKLNRLSVTNKTNGFLSSITNNNNNNKSIIQQQNHSINDIINKKPSLSHNNNKPATKTHTFLLIEPNIYDNELKNWFLECVRSIKKEISSRKSGFVSPAVDVMRVTSLEEFKTIDRLRLLEMFLENEKLLVYMYQKVFPDRLKEIQAFLGKKEGEKGEENNKANRTMNYRDNGFEKREQEKDQRKDESIDVELLQERQERRPKNDSQIRVKSVSKASKSQPIRNRIIMRDGKLNLIF